MAFLDAVQNMFKRSAPEDAPAAPTEWKSQYVDGTVDEKKIVTEMKTEFEKRREARVSRELSWQLNKEFLGGNQYCDINNATRSVEETPFSYDDEEREVFNLIASKIEARLARLNRAKPAMMTRPSSDSQRDISTAKVSTKILRGTYVEVKMQGKFKTANAWAEQAGTVFHKDVWNPRLGRLISPEQDVHEGGPEHLIVPAFEIYPQSEYIEEVELQDIIHAKPFSVDDIESIYGLKLKGRTLDVYNLENSRISTGGMGYTASVQKFAKGTMDNSELVIERHFPPCIKYPKGKLITTAGDRLVVYMDYPFVDDQGNPYSPFTKQVCLADPGCFWGKTIIERLIPIQRRYNALKNRIHEYINRTVIPAWTTEQDTLLNKEEIQANGINSGDILERVPGSAPPAALQMPQMSFDAMNEEQRLRDLFTEISGVSDFASTSAAPAGMPGVGMELIKQQDDSRVSLTSENMEIAAKEIGRKWLYLYKQFVKLPRMTKVVGDEYTLPYIQDWSENDITSFDVTLETEDLLTNSIPQKRQQVTFLLSQGLFHDPLTKQILPELRAKLYEMFDLGNWEDAVSLDNLHIRRANEENSYFKRQMVPQINPLDQDDLHVREHTRFALTTEFEDLAREVPELRQVMLDHITAHKDAGTQKAMMGQPQVPQQAAPNVGTQASGMAAPNGGNPYGQHNTMAI
jgi:hypothetical protein